MAQYNDNAAAPQPQANDGYDNSQQQQQQPAAPTGDYKSGVAAMTTPKAIVRYVLWLFSLVAFATMADSPGYGGSSTFSFQVAAHVITWLWTCGLLVAYFFRDKIEAQCNMMTAAELVFDGIFLVMSFIGSCVTAAKCQGDYSGYCDYYNTPHASTAFGFLTSLCLVVCLVLDFLENKKAEGARA